MKACIHRGSKQIGGSCLEITSQGKSLIIDAGIPLDDENGSALLPDSLKVTDDFLGVLVSHYHIDHVGLIGQIPHIPYAMGEASSNIMKAAADFLRDDYLKTPPAWYLKDGKTFAIGPFEITPYQMDHSAYDAYGLLIKADGKSLFYSGDFRDHGRKPYLLSKLAKRDPGPVDKLLLEGTTIGGSHHTMVTEEDLEDRFLKEFNEADGMVLVNCSSQNIDRIVTVFRAAKRSGKKLIIDLYSAAILEAVGNPHIPRSDWKEVEIYIPFAQKVQIKREKLFPLLREHSQNRIYEEALIQKADKRVMLFRPSYLKDKYIRDDIKVGRFIYSQWKGYLGRDSSKEMEDWVESKGLDIRHIHTSGHASGDTLKRLADIIKPASIIPIHSFHPERYGELFENTVLHGDGEWWEI